MSTDESEKVMDGGMHIERSKSDQSHDETAHSKTIHRAKAATDKEHKMSLWQGIRTYPKAIGWSTLISLCMAMEAFDLCLLNTFCKTTLNILPPFHAALNSLDGLPQFQEHIGEKQSDGTYQIPALWQAGLSNGRQAAEFIGLIINGWVSEKFGYRWTVIVCLALIAAWTAIYFTANTLVELLVAGILSGVVSQSLSLLICSC